MPTTETPGLFTATPDLLTDTVLPPTETPELTAAAAPIPTPRPEPGAVLFVANAENEFGNWGGGNGWKRHNGMLIQDGQHDGYSYSPSPYTIEGLADYAIEFELQLVRGFSHDDSCYVEELHEDFGITFRSSEQGNYIAGVSKPGCEVGAYLSSSKPTNLFQDRESLTEQRFDPGMDWHTYRVEAEGDELRLLIDGGLVLRTRDNRFLEGGNFEFYANGVQLVIRSVRVIVLGGESASRGGSDSDGAAVSGTDLEDSRSRIAAMLPDEGEVPNGLVVIDDERRTLDVLTQNYANPVEALRLLTELDWEGNVVRRFGPDDGVLISAGLTSSVYVSIHRFGDADGARQALDYSFQDQLTQTANCTDLGDAAIGDYSRAMSAAGDDGTGMTIYVQVGTALVRVSTFSDDGDPYGDAVAVVNVILGKI